MNLEKQIETIHNTLMNMSPEDPFRFEIQKRKNELECKRLKTVRVD